MNSNSLSVIGLVGLILTASYFVHLRPLVFNSPKIGIILSLNCLNSYYYLILTMPLKTDMN